MLIIDLIESVHRINTKMISIDSWVKAIHIFFPFVFFVCCDNRNPNEPQDEKLRLSKERNRFKSVNWEPYDKKQRKYMEIGEFILL